MNLEELLSECTFERVTPTLLEQCEPFACGHDDLDEFFRSDYKLYADKLLGKTYAFRLIDNPSKIVSIFTLSNDAIRIKQLVAEDKEQIEYVTENGEKKPPTISWRAHWPPRNKPDSLPKRIWHCGDGFYQSMVSKQ